MASASAGWKCTHTASVTATTDTSVTITVTCYWQNDGHYYDINNVSAWVYCNGVSYQVKNAGSISNSTTTAKTSCGSHAFTVNKTTASQSISCYAKITSNSSYVSGTKTSTATTVSVPAKTSYTITYNANGGSGAPSSQTKWYGTNITLSTATPTRTGYSFAGWATSSTGAVAYAAGASYTANASVTLYAKWTAVTYTVTFNANGGSGAPSSQTKTYGVSLTLSSTKPTRTNYTFKGWGTSASATTVAYAAGASYTANASVTLYAIWELAYVLPRISNAQAVRCTSDGNETDEGTYIKVKFGWATDRSVSKIGTQWKDAGSSTWNEYTEITASGNSGTADKVLGGNWSAEKSYDFRIYVADSGGTTYSPAIAINTTEYAIDVKKGGIGVAIGKVAETDNLFEVALKTKFLKGIGVEDDRYTDNVNKIRSITDPLSFRIFDVYGQSNMPTSYGNVMEIVGRYDHWQPQIYISSGADDPYIYVRNKHYNSNSFGSWRKIPFADVIECILNNEIVFKSGTNDVYFGYRTPSGGTPVYNWIFCDGNAGRGDIYAHSYVGSGAINVVGGGKIANFYLVSTTVENNTWLGFYNNPNHDARYGWIGYSGANAFRIFNEQNGHIEFFTGVDCAIKVKRNGRDGQGYVDLGTTWDSSGAYGSALRSYFSDGNIHDIVLRDPSGTVTYFGYAYATVVLRGSSVRLGSATGTVVTSDRNLKKDIVKYDERYEKFYDSLNPVKFKYILGTSGRTHCGFVAQDVEEALENAGLTTQEFGGISIYKNITREQEENEEGEMVDITNSAENYLLDKGITEMHNLTPEEFISLNTWQIQKLKKTVNEQQKEIDELKSQINDLRDIVLSLNKKGEL